MSRQIRVTYLGYCVEMLKYLEESRDFIITNVIGVRGRMSGEQMKYITEHDLEYRELSEKKELKEIDDLLDESEIAIVYKFEYIIPQTLIDKYTFFNFHGGNLKVNRGAHAVVWSILNGDKETCLTLYKLTGGIDVGIVVGEYFVELQNGENTITLNEKMWKGIPYLLELLKKYLNGSLQGRLVTDGKYLRRIEEQDYTIDYEKDSLEKIIAKVNSQVSYRGAIVQYEGNKYYIKKIKCINTTKKVQRTVKKGKNILTLNENGKILVMKMEKAD